MIRELKEKYLPLMDEYKKKMTAFAHSPEGEERDKLNRITNEMLDEINDLDNEIITRYEEYLCKRYDAAEAYKKGMKLVDSLGSFNDGTLLDVVFDLLEEAEDTDKKTQLETLQALKIHLDDTIDEWMTVDEHKINDDDFKIEINVNKKSFKLEVNADFYSTFQHFVDTAVKEEHEYTYGKVRMMDDL